jgi:hypothetical protein
MQGSAWIGVLRRVPAHLHDALAFGLVTGAEVVVQQLIKFESEVVIVRGRMTGSTAEGRVLVVPYSHLVLVAFNRHLSETEAKQIFGKGAAALLPMPDSAPAPAAAEAAPAAPPQAQEAAPAAAVSPSPAPPARAPAAKASEAGAAKLSPPSKSMLLARLRERLADKGK